MKVISMCFTVILMNLILLCTYVISRMHLEQHLRLYNVQSPVILQSVRLSYLLILAFIPFGILNRIISIKCWVLLNLVLSSFFALVMSHTSQLTDVNAVIQVELVFSCLLGICSFNLQVASFSLLLHHTFCNRLRIIQLFECGIVYSFALAPPLFELIQFEVKWFYSWISLSLMICTLLSTLTLVDCDELDKENPFPPFALLKQSILPDLGELFAQSLIFCYLFDTLANYLQFQYGLTSGDLLLLLEFALSLVIFAYWITPFLLSINFSKELFFATNTILCVFTMFCLVPVFKRPLSFTVFFGLILCSFLGSRQLFICWNLISKTQTISVRTNNPLDYATVYSYILFTRIGSALVWQQIALFINQYEHFFLISMILFILTGSWFLLSHILKFEVIRPSAQVRVLIQESEDLGEYALIVHE